MRENRPPWSRVDAQTLASDSHGLARVEREFAGDAADDAAP